MSEWLEGPPTEPGLYWYQLQGSAHIRSCEVFRALFNRPPIKIGDLVCYGGCDPGGLLRTAHPLRRWMLGGPKPEPDHTWLDPRYVVQLAERTKGDESDGASEAG